MLDSEIFKSIVKRSRSNPFDHYHTDIHKQNQRIVIDTQPAFSTD